MEAMSEVLEEARMTAPESSNLRSIFRTGQLFMQGAYSDEREWVDADEYRLLTRMHRQMCEIAAMRWDEIERLRKALGLDQPWPLPDVLAKLIQATEHLLKHHDCDAHGHEEYRAAADYGQALLLVLRAAPESRDG